MLSTEPLHRQLGEVQIQRDKKASGDSILGAAACASHALGEAAEFPGMGAQNSMPIQPGDRRVFSFDCLLFYGQRFCLGALTGHFLSC